MRFAGNRLHILIAPNAFKESLSAMEAADAIAEGIRQMLPLARLTKLPIADGGDGTLEAVVAGTQGKKVKTRVLDPLGNVVTAEYGITGDGRTAIIEMSRASGLALVPPARRNPMTTTSFGTGQLIQAVLRKGVETIILGIGGSATVDGGIGAIQALGVRFLDDREKEVDLGGKGLVKTARIDLTGLNPKLCRVRLLVACDVSNPLIGPQGAAAVFGPQKGATPPMVRQLDQGLANLARLIRLLTGKDVSRLSGAGAAGGIAGSFHGLLGARLQPGSKLVFDLLQVGRILPQADLVITGEGQLDYQTAFGKGPGVLAKLAKRHKIPVIGLAGSLGRDADSLYKHGFSSIFSIVNGPVPLETAMRNAAPLLKSAARQVAGVIQLARSLKCEPYHD